MRVIDYYPIILMLGTGCVWICTARKGNHLLVTFWERLPQIAEQELDRAVGRSIKNGLFPFRHRAAEVLRGDDILWRLRQRFLFWATLSLLVPVLGFLGLAAIAILGSRQ